MSTLALMEVQRALYTKLSGDGVLMGMVSGIYDNVPQNAAMPYLVIGDGSQQVRATDVLAISECQLRLQVWTELGGRKAALAILNRLQALLHLGTLTLSGFQLVMLRVEQASTALSEQGMFLSGELVVSAALVEV